jgi:hypothetical protein
MCWILLEHMWCVCFLGSSVIYNLRCSCRKWTYSIFSCVEFSVLIWHLFTHEIFHFIYKALDYVLEYVEVEHFNIHTVQYRWRPAHIKHTTSPHNAIIWIRHYIPHNAIIKYFIHIYEKKPTTNDLQDNPHKIISVLSVLFHLIPFCNFIIKFQILYFIP